MFNTGRHSSREPTRYSCRLLFVSLPKTMMIEIPNLEFQAAYACNLYYAQCSHYSNFHSGGIVSVEEARANFDGWQGRLAPKQIAILGGEPTLNPKFYPNHQVCSQRVSLRERKNDFQKSVGNELILWSCLIYGTNAPERLWTAGGIGRPIPSRSKTLPMSKLQRIC